MKRTALVLLAVFVSWRTGFVHPLYAQTDPPLPTITFFASDVTNTSLASTETVQTPVHVSWQVAGVQPRHRIRLHVYQINTWEPLLSPGISSLPTSGSLDVVIELPNPSRPPVIRLAVMDVNGALLDQRILALEFLLNANETLPQIVTVNCPTTTLDAIALANRTARVDVAWSIRNRPLDTNLIFEQVLDDGRTVSVEPPHPGEWIPSEGEGVLAPVLPESGRPVQLRLRVIGVEDGVTLAEMALPPIPVTDGASLTPAPTQPFSEQPGSAATPEATDPATFCSDPRALELIESLTNAVRRHDGSQLASLVSPLGLYIALEPTHTNHLTPDEVRSFFDDRSTRSWGSRPYGPTDGPTIQASLAEGITTLLETDLLPGNVIIACNDNQDDLSSRTVLYSIKIPGYEIGNFYSVMRPGPPQWELDWGAWGLGIEYWQGRPALFALTHYYWTP